MEKHIVDISYTETEKVKKGRKLFKNINTGEIFWEKKVTKKKAAPKKKAPVKK